MTFALMIAAFLPAAASPLYLYKVEQKSVEGLSVTEILQFADYQELKSASNTSYVTNGSVDLPAGSCWVIASAYPRLYNMNSGAYDYSVSPTIKTLADGNVEVYTEADRNAGNTAVVYQVPETTKGTMIFDVIDSETANYRLAEPVYFKTMSRGAYHVSVAYYYDTEEAHEMYTLDGETYTINRVELYKDTYININTFGDYTTESPIKSSQIITADNGVEFDLPATGIAEVQKQMVGSVQARRSGNVYETTLIPATPTPVFLAIANNGSITKTESYLEFEVNEDREAFDYDYVLDVPAITGGDNANQSMVFTYSLPKAGGTLQNPSTKVEIKHEHMAVVGKDDKPGTELTFDYKKVGGHRYVFPDGNFHGKIYISAKKNDDGSTVANTWVGKVVVSRSAEDIMNEFAGNNDLLDNEVNGLYPLVYSSKPILHDNVAFKNETYVNVPNPGNDGATSHELIFMEKRHALTGVDCNINHLAGGSLASVVNVQSNLANMMSSDLRKAAEFVGIVNVKLATAPLVSVRDEKHYYARGTEAGFNLASGSGTNVLSLSVIETLSLAFYRDGKLMAIVPAASQSGKGVDLSLINISSEEGSYDIKAVSPVVFDEVCLYNTGGLKLEVGNALKVNYAFVGTEANSELTLGSKGRAAFNAQKKAEGKDYELYIHSYSTPAHISGGEIKDGNTKGGNFVGDEDKSENLTNTLSLVTLGMGWAEMKLDAVGKDAPADYEQLFSEGSRVNFRLKSTKVLSLGLGTGNTVTFFTRKNVVRNADGSIKSIDWDENKQVLSATVLQLDVVSIDGDQYVSMVAPCDFSGVRLDINDGLVNLGGTDIYYASITPSVVVPHKCELGIPSKIFLNKTLVKYYNSKGELIPSKTKYEDITTYTPTWDTEVASQLEWSFDTDVNGNILIPEGSQATLDASTGTLSDIDMEGEYVVRYSIPGDDHFSCAETVTYVVDHRATTDADDDEIRSIIGNGFILQNEDGEKDRYALTLDTHGVTSGELLEIAKAIENPQNVLDGKVSTYASAQKGISLAQNSIMLGVRALNGEYFGTDDGTGHLKNPVRIGFIVEENTNIVGIKALNYLEMRVFDQQGDVKPVHRSLIEENATVGADLIGQKQVVKKRYSILVPAKTKLFNEFSLWNCGVANIDLNEMRMYGTFVEEVDPENQNENWAVGDRHDLIWKDATAVPMNVAVVNAASGILKNLDFMVDNDLNTAFEMGDGLGVGQGQIFRIELGRVVSPNEKIGIIMGDDVATVNLEAGNWMQVRLYPPVKEVSAKGQRKVASSDTPHTSVKEWNVLGAEVAGYGDRKGLYLTPSAPTSAMEIELGNVATAASNSSIYGITVAPRADTNVRFEKYIPTSIDEVNTAVNACEITVDEGGVAVVTAGCDIKDAHIFSIDGKIIPCHASINGNRAEIQLGNGIFLIQLTMVDGNAQVFKVGR